MADRTQSTPINDQRQLREQIGRLGQQQRDANESDVIIEYPRRLLLRSPNGHYWAIGVTDAGMLTASDVGDMPQ